MKQHQQLAPVGRFGLLAEAGLPAQGRRSFRPSRPGPPTYTGKIQMNDTKFDMPYIQDPTVYKAVMFARKMIREDDLPAGVAITRAADYYEVEPGHVAHYVGLAAQRIRARKARPCAGGR